MGGSVTREGGRSNCLTRRRSFVTLSAMLPSILLQVSSADWIRSRLPEWLKARTVLLENWQWIGLLLAILLGVILNRLAVYLLRGIIARLLHRRRLEVEDGVLYRGLRPFGIMAMGALWWLGLLFLDLPAQVTLIFGVAAKLLVVGAGVWGAYRLVDVMCALLAEKAARTATKFDDILIPLLRTTLKVFITAFGIVFLASNLNIDVSSLLAGLGIGGLAFALAAQDTVKNLFGSVTILVDRTFSIGDWVKVGDVEGTVEEVGLRSTRIRTFYNSLVTIPNSTMLGATIDNLGRRRYRRWYTHIGVTYDTPPEKLEAFCEGIRELIRRHPYTRKDYYHVYLHNFAESSLEIMLYVFWETPDWGTELRERHRLFIDIVRLAGRLGVEFAFPTRTLYMVREEKAGRKRPSLDAGHVEEALQEGRREARSIVRGLLQGDGKPPPVTFDLPSDKAPGESKTAGGEADSG